MWQRPDPLGNFILQASPLKTDKEKDLHCLRCIGDHSQDKKARKDTTHRNQSRFCTWDFINKKHEKQRRPAKETELHQDMQH